MKKDLITRARALQRKIKKLEVLQNEYERLKRQIRCKNPSPQNCKRRGFPCDEADISCVEK